MHRKLLSKTLFTLHIHNVSFCVWDIYGGEELSWLFTSLHHSSPSSFFRKTHYINNGSVIYYDQHQSSIMTSSSHQRWPNFAIRWRVVKSEQALFTSHNPSVYRGFRGICEEWRVKSRVGFFSRKNNSESFCRIVVTVLLKFISRRIIFCLAMAQYCPS